MLSVDILKEEEVLAGGELGCDLKEDQHLEDHQEENDEPPDNSEISVDSCIIQVTSLFFLFLLLTILNIPITSNFCK